MSTTVGGNECKGNVTMRIENAQRCTIEQRKAITGDYAHYVGDMTFSKKTTPLQVLLEKYRSLHDPPVKYIGSFVHPLAECKGGVAELFDPIDIRLSADQHDAVEGETYRVVINNREKKTVFVRWINEPFYKWETKSGLFLIFLQSDVDTLTEREKDNLHIE
jgi:hypothetical protein